MKRLPLLLACLCLISSAFAAGILPTQAWRRIFNTGTNSDSAGGVEVDASGNGYLQYISAGGGHNIMHVVKVGAASGVLFDKTIDFGSAAVSPAGLLISPMVSGKQYVYAFVSQSSTSPYYLNVYKYDTNGTAMWVNPTVFSGGASNQVSIPGKYADAAGNLLLAVGFLNPSTLSASALMVTVDSTGNLSSQQSNNIIFPQSAVYVPASHGWVMAGLNLLLDNPFSDNPALSGRWDFFDAATGQAAGIGEHGDGSISGLSSSSVSFIVNPLPGDAFAIVHNTSNSGFLSQPTVSTILKVYSAPGALSWQYPPSIPWATNTLQIVRFNASSPYIMLSQSPGASLGSAPLKIADEFDSGGALVWQHTHQPADVLLPYGDGFFTAFYNAANSTEYLEHADLSGVYDFGKPYLGTATGGGASFAGFKSFQNTLYFVDNMFNSSTSTDVVLDRFVTGICMQNVVSASPTVQGGQGLQITINLNGPAPIGGISVGVSTSNNKLLLPNSSQGQFITIPAGSQFVTFTLSAQAVSGNVPTRILAIQNGIRRFVDVTVTP